MSNRAPETANSLDALFGIRSDRADVVSCYVQLDPESRRRQKYYLDIKQRTRHLSEHLQSRDDPALSTIAADLARILEWLAVPERLPSAPGVALFACERLNVFAVLPLPRVHRNRLGVAPTPLLHGVIDAREALGTYLAVLLDRLHGRVFEVDPTGATELPGIVPIGRPGGKFHGDRQDAPGWGERDYHQRLETEAHRHYARIADAVKQLIRTRPIAGIALLGPDEHCRGLATFLPRATQPIVMGHARMNPKAATDAEVATATWQLRDEQERLGEAALLEKLEDGIATGWAVNGARETLRALARGQVRTLIVPDTQAGGGFRCLDTQRLVLSKGECRGEGAAEPVMELVDAAIDEALSQRADVVVIDDAQLVTRVDGLGALLRFRDR